MQPSWVTDEEFGMGYLELKPAQSLASKSLTGNVVTTQNGSALNISQSEAVGEKTVSVVTQHLDSGNSVKDKMQRTRPADGRLERAESVPVAKSDQGQVKLQSGALANGSDGNSSVPSASVTGTSRSLENQNEVDESVIRASDENVAKVATKNSVDYEVLCSCVQVYICYSFLIAFDCMNCL